MRGKSQYRLEWQVWEDYIIGPETVRSKGKGEYRVCRSAQWGPSELLIYPQGFRTRTYEPGLEASLPSELARVNRPFKQSQLTKAIKRFRKERPGEPVGDMEHKARVETLVGFLRQFGNLGQTVLEGKPRIISHEGQIEMVDGDVVMWALHHAENVYACLWLLGKLKAGEWSNLREFFYERRRRPRTMPTIAPPWNSSIRFQRIEAKAGWKTVKSATRELLAELINPNLIGVERSYDNKLGTSVFEFKALIQVVYWRLADFSESEFLRQCIECHTYFFAQDGRQKFCPPRAGVSESRCGRRHRQREGRSVAKSGVARTNGSTRKRKK